MLHDGLDARGSSRSGAYDGRPLEAVLRPFGELEAVIMDRIWSQTHPVTVREVLEELEQDPSRSRAPAYTTILTVMDNLHRKGWLQRQMEGRAYRYGPTSTREQHSARLMSEALAESANSPVTLMHFLEQMPPEDASALQRLLRRSQRKAR